MMAETAYNDKNFIIILLHGVFIIICDSISDKKFQFYRLIISFLADLVILLLYAFIYFFINKRGVCKIGQYRTFTKNVLDMYDVTWNHYKYYVTF